MILGNLHVKPIYLYILPRTSLFPLLEEEKLTAEEVVYAYAGWKFVYHFLNKSSEEYTQLSSSSLEVLAALCFTEEEHEQHMRIKGGKIPQFYKDYVVEVQNKIEENARLEFECIWNEHVRTKVPMCTITDKLSEKINQLNLTISTSNLWNNHTIKKKVLSECFPTRGIQELLGLNEIVRRLPESDCWDGLPQNRPTFDTIVNTRLPSIISTLSPDLVQVLSHVRAELQNNREMEKEKTKEKRMTLVVNKNTTTFMAHHRITQRRPEVLTSFSTVYERIQNLNWNNLQQEIQQRLEPKTGPVAKENFIKFQDPQTDTSNRRLKRTGTVATTTPFSSTTVTPSTSPSSSGIIKNSGTENPSPNGSIPEQQQQQNTKNRFTERSVSVSVSSIAQRVKAFQMNALSVFCSYPNQGTQFTHLGGN